MSDVETITTSIAFITGDICNRDGTDEDVEAIKKAFGNTLKSEVHNFIGFSRNDLQKKMREIKTETTWRDKFRQCNFVAIFCLSHGDSDGRIGQNKDIKKLKTTFLNPFFKIAELDGKLKWLAVQSCRGKYNDLAKKPSSMQHDGDENVQNVPHINYYLISYCTGEGTYSAQEDKRGKLYIQELCKKIIENAGTIPLLEILKNVHDAVEQHSIDNEYENFSRPVLDTNCPNDYRLIG